MATKKSTVSKPKLISDNEFLTRLEELKNFLQGIKEWKFNYELHKVTLQVEPISSKVLLKIAEYLEADFKVFPDTNPRKVCVVFTKKE